MKGDERENSGGAEDRDQREEQGNRVERSWLDQDVYERPRWDARRPKEREQVEGEWRREGDRREHRQHRGGSRNRDCKERGSRDPSDDRLMTTDRKKRRIEEKEKQACTIFVGDLNPETSAEQLTGLFKRFGSVMSSKIKENYCYGFVTFEKREAAEVAIAAGQNGDGIELPNGKQVYVSWALGSLPEWKKGVGGFTVSPGKDLVQGHRSRKGVVKPSVLAAATAAAAAKANAVLASMERASSMEPLNDYKGRAIVAYDDLL